MILVMILVGGATSYVITSGAQTCTCSKISSTNIPVIDEESVGTVIAFYLSEDFYVIKTEKTNKCKQDLYKMSFATFEDSQRELYVTNSGDVYKC